jgi:hypothetical protein
MPLDLLKETTSIIKEGINTIFKTQIKAKFSIDLV